MKKQKFKEINLTKKISVYITDFGIFTVNETNGTHRSFDNLKEVAEYIERGEFI